MLRGTRVWEASLFFFLLSFIIHSLSTEMVLLCVLFFSAWVSLSTAKCSSFCSGASLKTRFAARVASARDLVEVELTSFDGVKPAIGHPKEFSYRYTATVKRVLKGCLQVDDVITIHQIKKTGQETAVDGCPNTKLGHGAELGIWNGVPKKNQRLRSTPVPRKLTPIGGRFLVSGCRLANFATEFYLDPCGIQQSLDQDWVQKGWFVLC